MKLKNWRRSSAAAAVMSAVAAFAVGSPTTAAHATNATTTTTPIKHVVVLFDENESYDHYFGTYPNAANTDGPKFTAKANTPSNENLLTESSAYPSGAINSGVNSGYLPTRLSHSQAFTCDQNHSYTAEQNAVNGGKMNSFVTSVNNSSCTGTNVTNSPGLTMDYYDGNTVTALWNLAQNYAMSDNSWDATFGPSTPGALNLVSGQTHGFTAYNSTASTTSPASTDVVKTSTALKDKDANGVGTVIADPDPVYDDCSDANHTSTSNLVGSTGTNVGDLLNAKGVSWGYFQGGFSPTTTAAASSTGYAICGATSTNLNGAASTDYSPHHSPFQYYKSTSNPHHLEPASVSEIGHSGQANHQYDLSWFPKALDAGDLPAVSYVRASEYQDGHPGYSDPLDEQNFIVKTVNEIEHSSAWKDTAIVIAYDDSDGWYDHVAPTILNSSNSADATDAAVCTTSTAPAAGGYQDRCGPSQRLPMLVISPYAKQNYVDHTETTQPSILKFIEQNWSLGTVGDSSFDSTAGSIDSMFDFAAAHPSVLTLASDGTVAGDTKATSATHLTVTKASYGAAPVATVTVTATGLTPTGNVTVKSGTWSKRVALGRTGAVKVSLPATLAVGKHTVTASYAGNDDLAASTATASTTVSKASTRTSASVSRHNSFIVVSAKVAGVGTSLTPTGSIRVRVAGHTSVVKLSSGRATVTVKGSFKGASVTVAYLGSSGFLTSSASVRVR